MALTSQPIIVARREHTLAPWVPVRRRTALPMLKARPKQVSPFPSHVFVNRGPRGLVLRRGIESGFDILDFRLGQMGCGCLGRLDDLGRAKAHVV